MKKLLLALTALVLYAVGYSQVRLVNINPESEQVTIKNFGINTVDISGYQFCLGPGQYNAVNDYSSIDGDLILSENEEVVFNLTSGGENVTNLPNAQGGLGLFSSRNFGSNSPSVLLDYVQWGAGNQARVSQAVTANRWDGANSFVSGEAPFNYIGGANDVGAEFWEDAPTGEAIVRLIIVDPLTETVTLKNFGTASEDIAPYFFCLGPGQYNNLANYTSATGDLTLEPNEEITFDLTSGSENVQALPDANGGLGLFNVGGNFGTSDPAIFKDYMQWGASDQNRAGQAVTAGRWDDEISFIDGKAPYIYLGETTDIGGSFWIDNTIIRIIGITPQEDVIIVKNFDNVNCNLSNYFFCTQPGVYPQLGNNTQVEIISGDLELAPEETITVRVLTSGGVSDVGGIFLFSSNVLGFNNGNPDVLRDFAQWSAPNAFRVENALNAGKWDAAGNFIEGNEPFNYIGEANDVGSQFWEGTDNGEAIVRLILVDPSNETVTLKNFGTASEDIAPYFFCLGPGQYNNLANYTSATGDLTLDPNEEITFDLTSGSENVQALPDANGGLGLFNVGGNFGTSDPAIFKDYMQWGASDQNRAGQAVTAGRWDDINNFVENDAPFNYIGEANDVGSQFWEGTDNGEAIVRLILVDPSNETVTLKNFGTASEDIAPYFFCLGPGQYNNLANYTSATGDLTLEPNEEITFDLTSGSENVQALPDANGGLGLFNVGGNFGTSDPAIFKDYMQWGASDQNRAGQAVTAGRWDDVNNFVENDAPFNYIGEANDVGSQFWEGTDNGEAIVRLILVDPSNETVTLKNFGTASEDIAPYFFCLGPGQYNNLANYTSATGDLTLDPNEEITFDLTSGSENVQALPDANGGLGLFNVGGNFGTSDSAIFKDYMQWGASDQNRAGQAVTAGRWDDINNFVEGQAPFTYVGGATEVGASFWIDNTIIRMTVITPGEDLVVVKNFDTVDRNLSDYFFCTQPGIYPQLGNNNEVEIISGDLDLAPGEEVTVRVLTSGGVSDVGGIFLFSSNVLGFNNGNPTVLRDFAQWLAPNAFRVENALAAGRWDAAANFIEGDEPFNYIGEANDVGSQFWEGTDNGEAIVRLILVDPSNETVTLKNFGTASEDIAPYFFCLGPGQYNNLANYTSATGDLTLDPNEEITFDLTSGSENVQALPDANGGLGLFNVGGNFGTSDPAIFKDYMQWGASDQNRAGQAVTAGRWDDINNFVEGQAPFTYVGGATEVGASFWIDNTIIRMTVITPGEDLVVVKNFDTVDRNLSDYFFCTQPGIYPQLGNNNEVEIISGDLDLAPGEEVTVRVLTSGGVSDVGGIFLFSSNVLGFNNGNPTVLRDFAQWLAPNAFRVENALAAGRWDAAANFIEGDEPFNYIGEANDVGSQFWEGTDNGEAIVRLILVDPSNETVTLKNFGTASEDIAPYFFCLGPGQYNNLANYTSATGDLTLDPNEEITFDLTSGSENVQALPDANGGLGLFNVGGNFGTSDPAIFKDYMQWGASDQNRAGQAVTAGRWDDVNNFVEGQAPFTYVGGATEVGASFWIDNTIIRMTVITPGEDLVVVKNFDTVDRNLSDYFFCTQPGIYPQLGNNNEVEIISGDLDLAPGEEVTVRVLTSGGVSDVGGIFLFSSNVLGFNNGNPAVLRDFAQWLAPNAFRVENALAAGRWDAAANFIEGDEPFNYIGEANDVGSQFWEGTDNGEAIVRLILVDPSNETVTLKNFGTASEDIAPYFFCLGPGQYNNLANYTSATGDLTLDPNEEITFDLTSGSENVQALPDANGGLGLFNVGGNFGTSDPAIFKDYMQWGASDQNRAGQAVTAGRWDDVNNFVEGQAPFTYVGGATEVGASFWIDNTIIRMTVITPGEDLVVVKNFDTVDRNLSDYFFCTQPGIYPQLGNNNEVEIISGDLDLAPGEEVTVRVLTSGGVSDVGGIFLFSSNVLGFNNGNPTVLRDFAQWLAPNAFRVENALAAGRWDAAANFIEGDEPFNYIGEANDVGSQFWEGTILGEAIIRFLNVDPSAESITIVNLGFQDEDISEYFLCLGPGQYNNLADYSSIDGDLILSPDEDVTIDLTSGTQNVPALPDDQGGLGLFSIGGNFGSSDPTIFKDYIQWGASDQNRSDQAVVAGRWDDANNFVIGLPPFDYIGGANDVGASFWKATMVGEANVRLIIVDPSIETIRLKNFGTLSENLETYFFCLGPGQYNSLANYTSVSGDLILDPNEEITFDLTSGSENVQALPDNNGGLGLFSVGGNFGTVDPEIFRDYVQWGTGNQNRSDQAVNAGRWDNVDNFVENEAPFNYIGDADDIGSEFWEGTILGEAIVRLILVDPSNETVTLKNFGTASEDIAPYFFCLGPGQYNNLANYTSATGDLTLDPNEEITFDLTSGSENVQALPDANGGLGLFNVGGNFGTSDPAIFKDYMQWGASDQNRAGQAVTAGRWDDINNFVENEAPFNYIGEANDVGSQFWEGTIIDLIQVVQFDLVDRRGTVLKANLKEGDVINLADFTVNEFNIRAITDPKKVGSVKFRLRGPVPVSRVELFEPYDLFGTGSSRRLSLGSYELTATPFSESRAEGDAGIPLTINFTVIREREPQVVKRFDLTDKNGNVLLANLTDGSVIKLNEFSIDEFNIRATTNPARVGSLKFRLRGPVNITRVENFIPYDLFGTGSDRELKEGEYELSATPFTNSNARGTAGETSTIRFRVVKDDLSNIEVVRFDLTDKNGRILKSDLQYNEVINISDYNTDKFNIRAVTNPNEVGSVTFQLSGPISIKRTERFAPYDLFGTGSDRELPTGKYSIKATPFTNSNGSGQAGQSLNIRFRVENRNYGIETTQLGSIETIDNNFQATLEVPAKVKAEIYPNPASNVTSLRIEGTINGNIPVRILNVSGNILQSFELEKFQDRLTYELDTSNLVEGIYFVQLLTENNPTTIRLVIQK